MAHPLDEAVALTGKDANVIVLENDLYRRLPPRKSDAFLGAAARMSLFSITC